MQFLKSSLAVAVVVGGLSMASQSFAMPVSNVAPAFTTDAGQGIGVQKVWWRYGYGWRRPWAYGYAWRRPYGYGWRRPWIYGYGPGRRWGGGGYGYGWHNRRLVGSRAR